MEFYVMVFSSNSYGSHTTVSAVADFFLHGADDFGKGIKEITVTFVLHASPPRKNTLDLGYKEHQQILSTLPKVVFRRSAGKMQIDVPSRLFDGRDWQRSPRLSLPLFKASVAEVIGALALMKQRVKASDDFNVDGFLAHCESRAQQIPDSEDDLQILAAQFAAASEARRNVMSPWERLGIDWDDYHPDAKELLDDPFFWQSANDFSPHGNDTGSDLLNDYRDWLKKNSKQSPLIFLESLIKRWGFRDTAELDEHIFDEATIALAFADIKLRGTCDPEARDLALKSIERQRAQVQRADGWEHQEEKLKTLNKMEAKLPR